MHRGRLENSLWLTVGKATAIEPSVILRLFDYSIRIPKGCNAVIPSTTMIHQAFLARQQHDVRHSESCNLRSYLEVNLSSLNAPRPRDHVSCSPSEKQQQLRRRTPLRNKSRGLSASYHTHRALQHSQNRLSRPSLCLTGLTRCGLGVAGGDGGNLTAPLDLWLSLDWIRSSSFRNSL